MDDVPAVWLPEDKSHHRNIPSIQNYQWPLSTIINQSLTHNPKLQLKRDSPWLTTFCPSQRYHLRIFELHALHGAQAVVVAVEARLFVSGFGHHLPGTVDKAWRIHQQGCRNTLIKKVICMMCILYIYIIFTLYILFLHYIYIYYIYF